MIDLKTLTIKSAREALDKGQFSCVDLIEDLQQDEGIEEDAIVLTRLIVPLGHSNR